MTMGMYWKPQAFDWFWRTICWFVGHKPKKTYDGFWTYCDRCKLILEDNAPKFYEEL